MFIVNLAVLVLTANRYGDTNETYSREVTTRHK